jgi:anti-sigma factor RsiW
MHRNQHPDTEQLDQLRAGLLDDQTDEKAALESHIEHCPSCQSLMNGWQQLGPSALGPQLDVESLGHSLQQARQQALNDAGKSHSRTFMPYATAALLLIAVSVGFWIAQPDYRDTPLMTADHSPDVPDLYEDIEFYLWLAEQNGNSIKSEETNPNST